MGENRQWSAKTLQIYFLGHGAASNNLPLLCAATFRGQKDERTQTEAGMISALFLLNRLIFLLSDPRQEPLCKSTEIVLPDHISGVPKVCTRS